MDHIRVHFNLSDVVMDICYNCNLFCVKKGLPSGKGR